MTRFSDGRLTRHEAAAFAKAAGYPDNTVPSDDMAMINLIREAFGAGWKINAVGPDINGHTQELLDECEEADWQEYRKTIQAFRAPPSKAEETYEVCGDCSAPLVGEETLKGFCSFCASKA